MLKEEKEKGQDETCEMSTIEELCKKKKKKKDGQEAEAHITNHLVLL